MPSAQPSETLQKVTDFFLVKSNQASRPLTNKKLQKLAYYAQAWNLVFNDDVMFKDPIEAWIHGPAIKSLYLKYREYGYLGIKASPALPAFDEKIQNTLDNVWAVYGKYDGNYLELLTHNEEPWIEARGNAEINEPTNIEIDPTRMKTFYAKLLSDVQSREATA